MFKYEKPLYSKRQSVAKRRKKATKTLIKLAMTDPTLKALIEKKATSIGRGIAKKLQSNDIPKYELGMRFGFYKTREWRDVRYKALVKHGKRCQCCNTTEGYLHVDHIKPRSLFPELELDLNNLQILCEACNIGKSNTDQTDWRQQ
jgi:hypothetical protein